MKKAAAPIAFASSEFGETHRLCACFNSDEEAYRVLIPFIESGFECRDQAIHVVDPGQSFAHRRRLTAARIHAAAPQQAGQLELKTNTEACLRNGRFDQERLWGVLEQLASGKANGEFPFTRMVCHMDGAAEAHRHIDDLVEFKSLVNDGVDVPIGGGF